MRPFRGHSRFDSICLLQYLSTYCTMLGMQCPSTTQSTALSAVKIARKQGEHLRTSVSEVDCFLPLIVSLKLRNGKGNEDYLSR